jgi:hypothetical protein
VSMIEGGDLSRAVPRAAAVLWSLVVVASGVRAVAGGVDRVAGRPRMDPRRPRPTARPARRRRPPRHHPVRSDQRTRGGVCRVQPVWRGVHDRGRQPHIRSGHLHQNGVCGWRPAGARLSGRPAGGQKVRAHRLHARAQRARRTPGALSSALARRPCASTDSALRNRADRKGHRGGFRWGHRSGAGE